MAGIERHMFPGNNTPKGFFSYYQYILGQDEADQIYCIKGGPGTGKSTFMKKIGEEMLADGHNIDFMHCSSDSNSLDGIVIRDKNIAFIDGTAPHIVDPVNPGAVDTIIHLGEFWDRKKIKENKRAIIENHTRLSGQYAKAYNYFAAAKKMYDNVEEIFEKATAEEAFYKIAANLTAKELAHKEINQNRGKIKKFFASGVTPDGFKNYLHTLVQEYENVYIFETPVGVSLERTMQIFGESAVYRGFDIEMYYCPMVPDRKIEHLLIPELHIAMITSNRYHTFADSSCTTIKVEQYIDEKILQQSEPHLKNGLDMMEKLMELGIECLKMAKQEHDSLEEYYIPNMNFKAVEDLRQEIMAQLR